MDEVPFRTVYLHGLVADEKGQKMSKSKGNTIDPLETIDTYGTDAFLASLLQMQVCRILMFRYLNHRLSQVGASQIKFGTPPVSFS